MAAAYHLTILTPAGTRFNGNAEAMVAHGKEGFVGVLAGHAPMISGLHPGPLSVTTESGTSWFACGPGVLEASMGNEVTVLVDEAWPVDSEEEAKEKVEAEYRAAAHPPTT